MAPDKTGYGSINMDQSAATSPTDTRSPPRFEPITRRDSNEADPESTIRINRPPVISASAGMYYSSNSKPESLGPVVN